MTEQMTQPGVGAHQSVPNGPAEPPGETLVAREAELRRVEQFLDAVRQGPSCLELSGELGAGKSAVWTAAVAAARRRDYRVLLSRPAESEQSLAFAGLGDLLDGVLDDPELRLPHPQDRALRVAVLMDDPEGPPPDQRAVSVATLTALRCLSEHRPVLIAIDDLHWLDRASARVLAFALRRLEGEPIAVVAAVRSDDRTDGAIPLDQIFADGRHTDLTVGPLDADALDALFHARLGDSVPRPHLTQIAAASGGNPLFALELARAMLRGDLRSAPGEPLFVPATLQQLVEDRLEELSPASRNTLFVAAAVNDPSVDLLVRASDPSADVSGSLEAATTAGVVDVSDGQVTFSHPLFASTLYHAVPPARRRAIHARLGQLVATTDERARHLALGANGPDPVVAAALDDAAHAAAARGAPDAAAELHERAHELTPSSDPEARTRRQVEAAECHFAAGDLERAQRLLEAAILGQSAGPGRASLLRRLAKVRYRRDSCSVAAELLTRALDEVGADASLRALVERDLAWSIMQCGDMRDAAAHIRSALEHSRATADETMLGELVAANAMAEFLLGNEVPAEPMHVATARDASATDTPIEWRPSMMLAMRLKWSGDIEEARARLDALRQHATEEGDETSLPFVLAQMSEAATLAGEFERAVRYADEAKRLATQTGQDPIRALAMYAEALAEVHLGHIDEARAAGQSALELAERAGSIVTMMLAQSVLGFADLSVDDAPAARSQLAPLVAWLDIVGIRHPGALWFIPEQVEALVGTGDLERADALLAGYEADAVRLGLPWSLLAAARARALLTAAKGDARGAGETLDGELRNHVEVPPFQRARALYVLGTIRRRTRQRKAARASLEAALEMFEALGAETWSAKARHMLGRADGVTRKQEEAALTPAERRVAQLVAAGSTNREVASRLFVSVRAVELHLTSIYRKLEIRSRTELAVRLAATATEPSDADGPTSAGGQEPAAMVAG